ncbi:MAG: type II secretion system protein GspF, partial [Deltaproteobacteria bacterium]
MPVFEYIALDGQGRKRKGIVEAGGMAAARQKLRETDVYPVELQEASSGKKEVAAYQSNVKDLFSRIGMKDVSLMTRQLSTLLGAGLPLVP